MLTRYYNNGGGKGEFFNPKVARSHMWLTAGYEIEGELMWTQPELLLYDINRSRGHG